MLMHRGRAARTVSSASSRKRSNARKSNSKGRRHGRKIASKDRLGNLSSSVQNAPLRYLPSHSNDRNSLLSSEAHLGSSDENKFRNETARGSNSSVPPSSSVKAI